MTNKKSFYLLPARTGTAAAKLEGIECWSARDLQILLGYSKWENFEKVIQRAKDACKNAGEQIENHFPDVRKMVEIGSDTEREINDIALTRYACYLIAQNGDSRKEQIAFAQNYFAVQTRRDPNNEINKKPNETSLLLAK